MPSLLLEIGASVARLQADMAKAQSTVDGFARSAKTAFAAIGGYIVGGAMVQGLTDMAQAYVEQERAINKMSSAMQNQGDYSRAALRDLEEYANQIQETTTVGDEQALSVMANLKSFGMLNDEVKAATQAAIDFASAKREEGMTIVAASEIIGKAYMGQTERLKRYGIIIDETKSRSEKFNEVQKQLSERFGGSAARELDTYEGKLKNVSNQFGEVKEKVGEMVLAFGTGFLPMIKTVISELDNAAKGLQMFFDTSARGRLEQKRLALTDELHEVMGQIEEVDQAASPGLFRRLYEGFFGAGTGAERAAERAAALEKEIQNISVELHKLDVQETKTAPGGKRFIPTDMEEAKKKAKEMEKAWRDVNAAQNLVSEQGWEDYAAGLISASEGVSGLTQMILKATQEAETFFGTIDKTKELIKDFGWEDYAEGLEGATDFDREINRNRVEAMRDTTDKMTELTENAANAMEDNFSDLFFNVMTGKFDDLGDYATGVFESIARAASDYLGQIATDFLFGEGQKSGRSGGMLSGLFGLFSGGGSGGILSGAAGAAGGMDALASLAMIHQGGQIGRDSFPSKWITAAAFSGAPRLHGGLASDEYPAILQKGETVIPKGDKGQTQQTPPLNIMINAVDSASFAQMAARNPSAITGPIMEALQKGGQLRNMIRGVI